MAAKVLRKLIHVYSFLKNENERLSVNTKLTLYKALIRFKMTHACLAW
jgi:hypothetical protein